MKPRTIIATIVLSVLPLFAVAAVQQSDRPAQQATTGQNTDSWMMAGHGMYHGMMNIVDRVKADLGGLANENDPAVLHNRLAQDQKLLNGIQMPGSGTMRGTLGISTLADFVVLVAYKTLPAAGGACWVPAILFQNSQTFLHPLSK